MLTAGRIFTQGLLKPPPNPSIVRYGNDELNNIRQKWYGILHGLDPTYLQNGVQIEFDPEASETKVKGPVLKKENPSEVTWRIGNEMVWNAEQGFVMLDLPTVKAAAGFLPEELTFRDRVKVEGIRKRRFDNDDFTNSQDKTTDNYRPYYSFTMVSEDGLPLVESKRIALSLVSTSQNLGFVFDPSKIPHTSSDAEKFARGIVSPGSAPVQVNRVGATVSAPFLKGKQYRKLDFTLRVFEKGLVDDKLIIKPDQPLFIARFE
jgi:hypothetical protein